MRIVLIFRCANEISHLYINIAHIVEQEEATGLGNYDFADTTGECDALTAVFQTLDLADKPSTSETAVARATKLLLKRMFDTHTSSKIRGHVFPKLSNTAYVTAYPVHHEMEEKLFVLLFTSAQFVKAGDTRTNFESKFVRDPRGLFIAYNLSKRRQAALARIDFYSMVCWWNMQVAVFHGTGQFLENPASFTSLSNVYCAPSFATGTLAGFKDINMDYIKIKDVYWLQTYLTQSAVLRVREVESLSSNSGLAGFYKRPPPAYV